MFLKPKKNLQTKQSTLKKRKKLIMFLTPQEVPNIFYVLRECDLTFLFTSPGELNSIVPKTNQKPYKTTL